MSEKITGLGLLVGRFTVEKHLYEYVVIPENPELDALSTTLPAEIMLSRYRVNTSVIRYFLPCFYLVNYTYKRDLSRKLGVIDKAKINSIVDKVVVDHENPVESFRKIDDKAEYVQFEDIPTIDIVSIAQATGTGSSQPKRLYSTQIATKISDDNNTHVLLNIVEAYLFIKTNPGLIRGVLSSPRFKLLTIILDPITKQNLLEIIYNTERSHEEFTFDVRRLARVEEEE